MPLEAGRSRVDGWMGGGSPSKAGRRAGYGLWLGLGSDRGGRGGSEAGGFWSGGNAAAAHRRGKPRWGGVHRNRFPGRCSLTAHRRMSEMDEMVGQQQPPVQGRLLEAQGHESLWPCGAQARERAGSGPSRAQPPSIRKVPACGAQARGWRNERGVGPQGGGVASQIRCADLFETGGCRCGGQRGGRSRVGNPTLRGVVVASEIRGGVVQGVSRTGCGKLPCGCLSRCWWAQVV